MASSISSSSSASSSEEPSDEEGGETWNISDGGGLFGWRSKSIAVRQCFAGGRRMPYVSESGGRGSAFVLVASDNRCCKGLNGCWFSNFDC